jgi:hypothetical protein
MVLMSAAGSGFSVERRNVSKLPEAGREQTGALQASSEGRGEARSRVDRTMIKTLTAASAIDG